MLEAIKARNKQFKGYLQSNEYEYVFGRNQNEFQTNLTSDKYVNGLSSCTRR